jgi:hypothetical protein
MTRRAARSSRSSYLSLRAHIGMRDEIRRIDFATLLTLVPRLGGRILIEGPAGAGKSTILRWAAIQAARWRLGSAATTDPLTCAPGPRKLAALYCSRFSKQRLRE